MTRRTRAPEAWVALLAVALLACGCARKMAPSGGPPDLDPPRILSTVPDSGDVRVPRLVHLVVTFSEGMDPRSATAAVEIAPRVDIRQRRWSGRALTLVLAESLVANRTYTLFVGADARDRHGNALREGRASPFTTAEGFPEGSISGRIDAVGFAVPGTYVWCYREGHVPDSTARDFEAIGLANDAGAFHVAGLELPGRYRLWAFADLNHNHSFEPGSDLLAPADTTFEITLEDPVASGFTVRVVNPRAQGHFKGSVIDSLGDGAGVVRLIVISQRDTLRRLVYELDSPAAFDLQFDPGSYSVRAFRDLDRNKIWRRDTEPASAETIITVTPGGTVEGATFVLERPVPTGGGP